MEENHGNIRSFVLLGDQVCRKCPFSSDKKWDFERPNLRTDAKNLAKHPPNWWIKHLVHSFPFLCEYQANFEKSHIVNRFGAIFPFTDHKLNGWCIRSNIEIWVWYTTSLYGDSSCTKNRAAILTFSTQGDPNLHAEEGKDQVQLNTERQEGHLDAKEGEDKV